jgi:hypothetical protein
MKRVAMRILAAMTAVAICLPLHALSAGDGLRGEPAAVPTAAAAQTAAAPAPVLPEEFTFIEELPEGVTAALAKAEETRAANIAGEVLPVTGNAGIYDKDPVTLIEFGSEFLVAYLTGLNNLTSRLVDTGGDYPEFIFEYDDNAGKHHIIYMGMYFDEANQLIIGRDQQGAFAIGFDVDLKQKMLYSAYNGWNRNMGFNRLYDLLAPAAGVFYQTHRIKFEYGGRDWMVQMWKGLYFFVGSGAEIGIYNKPQSRTLEHYDCAGDEDMLEMSIRVLRGDKVLLERAPQKHWWMNGFVPSDGLYLPGALTLQSSIRFEEEGMRDAFLISFEELCAREGITFTVEGNLVSFVW